MAFDTSSATTNGPDRPESRYLDPQAPLSSTKAPDRL
jgi:hypothetical protein